MFVLNVSAVGNLIFNSVDSSNNIQSTLTPLSATANSTYLNFKLKEWCSGGITSCPASGNNFRLMITGLMNVGTTMPATNYI